jgi:manganese-transporting P-type ATPase
MESLTENRALLYSLLISGGSIVALASGLVPDASTQFQLVELDPEVSVS